MSRAHAVIFAGGRGERLGGVRKADLRLGGVPFIERVARAMGDVAPPLLVAAGPNAVIHHLPQGAVAIADLTAPYGGPLAGLAAAVAALHEWGIERGLLVSAAVDTPLLPENFAAEMGAALGEARAGFVAWGEDFYPPNAVWRLEELASLPEDWRAGRAPPSLKALLARLGAKRIDWQGRSPRNPFANVNRLEDLLVLGREIAG